MLQLSAGELEWIRKAIHDKRIFLVVDESTLSSTHIKYSSWKPRNTSGQYLYDFHPVPRVPNSNSIAQVIDDALRSLGNNFTLSVFYCLMLQNIW